MDLYQEDLSFQDQEPPLHQGALQGYHKIRIVGKGRRAKIAAVEVDFIISGKMLPGAFGTAYLYRRIIDSRLVVIKEILLEQMTQKERQLARNEIKVLSSINHANIIR